MTGENGAQARAAESECPRGRESPCDVTDDQPRAFDELGYLFLPDDCLLELVRSRAGAAE